MKLSKNTVLPKHFTLESKHYAKEKKDYSVKQATCEQDHTLLFI